MKKAGFIKCIALFLALFTVMPMEVSAAEKRTIYNNRNVTFSPDGHAWTTDAGNAKYTWYPQGTTVNTGLTSSLPSLSKGEHYYRWERSGTVPVGRWTVMHTRATCIHSIYPYEDTYHGVLFNRKNCYGAYNSGWFAYCADCGEEITSMYIYMEQSTAESIHYLEMGNDIFYYYLCPRCTNLEQGKIMGLHMCKEVSANQYKVTYHDNADGDYQGYMPDSFHMYDNAEEYEGKTVTPVTHLTKNTYFRLGYEFVGWNTMPDGSGKSFEDGAEILNLSAADWNTPETWTDSDKGVVTLYAQWNPSRSTLYVDPGEGLFQGKSEITALEGTYGTVITIDEQQVTPPFGHTVSFEVNGGKSVDDIRGKQHFSGWNRSVPFLGRFAGGEYHYLAANGGEDRITACYEADTVILPRAEKDGYSFGGWYYDNEFSLPAGAPGDSIVPSDDITLYAQWVELVLYSEDNYTANGGRGAVDLNWTQSDSNNKSYVLYQSIDGEKWERINTADDISNDNSINVDFSYTGTSVKYTIPYTGIYTLTAQGAQGGSYGSYSGGAGGSTTGRFWLSQGEVLTCTVGGSNGFNGGGTSTAYGNGGGYTVFSSDRKGVLLIAGGGGGASLNGNGGIGGSVDSLVSNSVGERGMAGGGGGALGGSAGETVIHHHTGNSSKYGGCYTVSSRCQSTVFTEKSIVTGQYNGCDYIGADGNWHHDGYCVQCGSYVCSWHDMYEYRYTCDKCGALYKDYCPSVCTQMFGYSAGCGYAEGQVIGSYPAYGGSSYVNTEYAYSYEKLAGVRTGNGFGSIQSVQVGFVEELFLEGVTAMDMASPNAVSGKVAMESQGAGHVKLTWNIPRDNGTRYYHAAESFLLGYETALSRSNITVNTLTSGVAGYYYLFDENPLTTVNERNGKYTVEPEGTVDFSLSQREQKKYLHVAAVDVAGNLSATTHIPVESGAVAWKLRTRKLELEGGNNIYPAGEDAWYVRSDGVTPFTMKYEAYIEGMASADYQLNYVIFENQAEEAASQNIIFVPSEEILDKNISLKATDLTFSQQNKPFLQIYPYTAVNRSDEGRELSAAQKFVLSTGLSGTRFAVLPIAGAELDGSVVYSDHEDDEKNGLVLIADGEAPRIIGLEPLENRELIDRRDGNLTLVVTAVDELSGLREWYVSIVNTDNAVEKVYKPDSTGTIRIEITADEPLFSGDFAVTAFATDNVGNVTEISYGTTEFSLETHIERILEPHEPIFKKGESGILFISVWGYADRVEVEFPPQMTEENPELNRVFDYSDSPMYLQEEKVQFMIPLRTPENESYEITVRAYKQGRRLEDHPEVSVVQVNGTVLDQFRTRLR